MLYLNALYRYPVKSMTPEPLERALIDTLGIAGDRRWMVVDAATGRFLTQRLLPAMGKIEARWEGWEKLLLRAPGMPDLCVDVPSADDALRGVTVWSDSFQVPDAGVEANRWLSAFLERACQLVYMPEGRARQVDTNYAEIGEKVHFGDGFPLLLIGQGSLEDVSQRVGRSLDVRRFRPNLVIEGSEAFAEDDWKRLRIGTVDFRVAKPCSRCIMTTIDPLTNVRDPDREPLATLKTYREREGAIYFGQNLVPLNCGALSVGMPVEILE
ncbi:hypothetical protein IQ22_02735 [Pseudomonas duriflava]|uniref:MOSC domain-containing protein n=1 Tax=Pseudomonas duriflava TaxID=459528 RepID=A0A562Q9T2_9PSED|nr:MOSC domain-containing protein [Pseudomonas duriflava]TWI53517.1 hypothetical protein IQ22_02735 [Pseudomonas duriflava]